MYVPSFNGCRAKIERAKKHRDVLNDLISEMVRVETNHPAIGIKFRPETGEHVVYVSQMPEALSVSLAECGLILGDIFYNLRCALEHLTFQLALRNKDGRVNHEDKVKFPIDDKPTTFQGRCVGKGCIAELSPTDQFEIEGFQPYHGTYKGDCSRTSATGPTRTNIGCSRKSWFPFSPSTGSPMTPSLRWI